MDQVDVPLIDHEKERSVVNPRGPFRFISLFLLNHYYVIFEISNAFFKNQNGWLKIEQIISGSQVLFSSPVPSRVISI